MVCNKIYMHLQVSSIVMMVVREVASLRPFIEMQGFGAFVREGYTVDANIVTREIHRISKENRSSGLISRRTCLRRRILTHHLGEQRTDKRQQQYDNYACKVIKIYVQSYTSVCQNDVNNILLPDFMISESMCTNSCFKYV